MIKLVKKTDQKSKQDETKKETGRIRLVSNGKGVTAPKTFTTVPVEEYAAQKNGESSGTNSGSSKKTVSPMVLKAKQSETLGAELGGRSGSFGQYSSGEDRVGFRGNRESRQFDWSDILGSYANSGDTTLPGSELSNTKESGLPSRVGSTAAGSAAGWMGDLLVAAGAVVQKAADRGIYADEIIEKTGNNSQLLEELVKYEEQKKNKGIQLGESIRELGRETKTYGSEKIEEAKDGLGTVGSTAVDFGAASMQMGLDALAGFGNVMPSMLARSFGGGAEEAYEDGADLDQQVRYGLGSAAISYATEQISNVAFSGLKLLKPGIADDFLESGIAKLSEKLASTPAGQEALQTIAKLAVSFAGEGFEEILEDILSPYMKRLTYDADAQSVFQDPDQLGEYLYDGLIGGLMGLAGGASEIAVNRAFGQNTANQTVDDTLLEAAREVTANDTKENQQTASPVEAGTKIAKNEGNNTTVAQNGSESATDPFTMNAGQEQSQVTPDAVSARISENQAKIDQFKNMGEQNKRAKVWGKESGVIRDSYVEQMDQGVVNTVDTVAKQLGVKVQFVDSVAGGGANAQIKNGVISIEKNNENPVRFLFGHEITHRMQELDNASYQRLLDAVKADIGEDNLNTAIQKMQNDYWKHGVELSEADAMDEITANYVGQFMEDSGYLEKFIENHRTDKTLLEKLRDVFRGLVQKLTGKFKNQASQVEQRLTEAMEASMKQAEQNTNAQQITEIKAESVQKEDNGEWHSITKDKDDMAGVSFDAKTNSVSPSRLSLKTWNASYYVMERQKAAKEMASALGISEKKAADYIDSVNSIAKMIADDRVRLDYEASPGRSSFVSNAEYGGSIDFSTVCKKRRLFTGTFEAIQQALPNTALTAEEVLEIRSMMDKKGYEVSCGLCYVEGSRANMGQFTKQFLDRYKATNPDYLPTMAEMNTATGQEKLRMEHPEVYEAYEYFMNHYGRLNPNDKALFASQQKPKMYQLSTEYQGEILNKFRKKSSAVEQKNKNGGLRIQSFSDFEIIHLIDSMQVIMDMSQVGLAGQAYTKVPDFAWALGDTGLKINLSLIAKGIDSKGKLILDEKEGMSVKDAMALRDRYSENVGTILVVFNDVQLKAAMADERIDFIIPFHKSQWKTDQYEIMGLPKNAKDYTPWQNESYISPVYNDKGKKQRPDNFMPNTYWDFSKTGKENAETYLRMCAEDNRRPKFHYLLVNNNDGSYSLQPDGSTDGYWKTLIDFKMYDNDGNGAPQRPVRPDFNMEQAQRMLNEYTGGHSKFPAAQDVVNEFVSKYKQAHEGATFSMKGTDDLAREIAHIKTVGRKQGRSEADIQADVRAAVDEAYQAMLQEYGAIKPGEKPFRDVQVPKRTEKDKKVSQTVRTILEAQATPDAAIPNIEEMVATGEFSYDVYTDKKAIADADATIRDKGFASALSDWNKSVDKGIVSKANTAEGWALYNAAVNSGDIKSAMDVLNRMVEHQRNAAQAVQATRILKKLSPDAQLYGVQRSVSNLQEEINKRYKTDVELKINQELAEQFMNAATEEERTKALQDIYRDIGRQMPSHFIDKWNAWRYLSMLGNPRTHVRNILGNAGFVPLVSMKNAMATAMESAASAVTGGKFERTKAFVGFGKQDMSLLSAAYKDYGKAQEMVGDGKYSDFANANRYIEEGRVIFKNKALETMRKANSKALSVEDVWFSQPHYAYALAQYCKANGISTEQIRQGKIPDKARQYAIQEAKKATYNDTNALSDFLGKVGRYKGDNKIAKAGSRVVEGILPFRKTPANILARGIEYSPIGLMKSITTDLYQVQKGEMSGAKMMDNLSAGLTGTALMGLGVFLAAQGLVRGGGEDDEKEKKFQELKGRQDYSMELPNGTSITLDWLAPECLPFFVGVNLYEQMQRDSDGLTMSEILSAVSAVSDPMLEMSCLQSLSDVFDSVGYASSQDMNPLVSALASAATSYITQGLPTVFGQLERVTESERMTTYTEKNAFLTGDMQYALGRASGKVPGWDYNQIPYIDAWGRTEASGSVGERAFNNLVNPAYTSQIQSSPMEQELERLYSETSDGGVFPSRAAKYFNVAGERKDLTAEEYVQYATSKGQTSRSILEKLTESSGYKKLDDADKAAVVKSAYELANAKAKIEVSDYQPDGWIAKAIDTTKRYKVPMETYLLCYNAQKGIESIKDEDGDAIANSKGLLVMQMVYNTPGLTEAQRKALFADFGVGQKVIHYNKALVDQKVAELKKKGK